jgi:hypothetical protein
MSIDATLGSIAAGLAAAGLTTTPPATTEVKPVATETAPVVTTTITPPVQSVTVPIDQFNAFMAMQSRLAKVEEDNQRREAAAREEQVKILAAKGHVEEALRTQREESQRQLEAERVARATSEERAKRYALDGELARALGSQPLVAGGAEQLTQLLRDQFVVEPQGNSFTVRTHDFKGVGDHIGAMLGRPEFAHFLRAQNPNGGTGGATGTQSAPTPTNTPTLDGQPKDFSEAVIMQMAAMQRTQADPRLDRKQPMGLRPLQSAQERSHHRTG